MLATGKPRALERLDEIEESAPPPPDQADAVLKRSDPMTKMLEMATPALAKPLATQERSRTGQTEDQVANAGFRSEGRRGRVPGLEVRGPAGRPCSSAAALSSASRNQPTVALLDRRRAGHGLLLPSRPGRRLPRPAAANRPIFLGLPDALDLLVVCVEAGLGLDHAMRKVSDEMKRTHPVLSEELALTNFHLQMGRPRAEALHELGVRTGVADLRSLAAVLIQADKFGSSIAHALRVQSDSMRTRRRQLAEEKAAKTAVKLIFPLVLFIFPGIFVVLVGPAAITMIRDMFPMMQGN